MYEEGIHTCKVFQVKLTLRDSRGGQSEGHDSYENFTLFTQI